jgi:hypothetical protein
VLRGQSIRDNDAIEVCFCKGANPSMAAELGWKRDGPLAEPKVQTHHLREAAGCFAKELAAFGIKVNSADLSDTKTGSNNPTGSRTVEQPAGIVSLTDENASGPPGGFPFDRTPAPW